MKRLVIGSLVFAMLAAAPAEAAAAGRAVARGIRASEFSPAEVHATAGGATAGPGSEFDQRRLVDQRTGFVQSYSVTDTAQADASFAESFSRVADVVALNGTIRVAEIRARAHATSVAATADGSSIAGLTIAGVPIDGSVPNTRVDLPGGSGYVVVHEVIARTAGAAQEITVNMLHVFLDAPPTRAEIVIASAYAGYGESLNGPSDNEIDDVDDATSGRDAGADAASSIPIEPGVWSGGFTETDVRDVYSFRAGQGDRIVVSVNAVRRWDVEQQPVPPGPPATNPDNVVSYLAGSASRTQVDGPDRVSFDIALRDPSGAVRLPAPTVAQGVVASPDLMDLNADVPSDGSKGTWLLYVDRTSQLYGGYTIALSLPPLVLTGQEDGGAPGDAADNCAGARRLEEPATLDTADAGATAHRGVIRGTDPGDFFAMHVREGKTALLELVFDGGVNGADFDLFVYGPSPGGTPDCTSMVAWGTGGKTAPRAAPEAVTFTGSAGTYVIEVRRIDAIANYALLFETR